MKLMLALLIAASLYAQTPIGNDTASGGSGPSSTVSATPDYIVVASSATPTFTAKPYATETSWEITPATNVTAPTLVTTNVPNGAFLNWRIKASTYSFTWPGVVLNAPTINNTFCNAAGDVWEVRADWDGTNANVVYARCTPASAPTVCTIQNGSSGVITCASGTYTIGPSPTASANYGMVFPPFNWGGDFTSSQSLGANNQVIVFPIYVVEGFSVTKALVNLTAATGGSTIYVGIYNSTCSTLLTSGTASGASTGRIPVTLTSYALTTGRYYGAISASSTSVVFGGIALGSPMIDAFNNTGSFASNRYFGLAANAVSGGNLPSACGAISNPTSNVFPFIYLTN